ncbi:MAG: hypothetical protein ACYTDX_08315 [Planctomycetota bacterium]|jgi:hypothetical protein
MTVRGTILGESERVSLHTDLAAIVEALGDRITEFDWLTTDLETNIPEGDWPGELEFGDEVPVITGKSLLALSRREDWIQFTWGILSGLPRGMRIDARDLGHPPFANGNTTFWKGDPVLQFPGALVEIVCWDSTYTLLITGDDDLTQRFRAYLPEARDLDEYNRGLTSPGP